MSEQDGLLEREELGDHLQLPRGFRVDGHSVELDVSVNVDGDVSYRGDDDSIITVPAMCFIHGSIVEYMDDLRQKGVEDPFGLTKDDDYINPSHLCYYLTMQIHDAWHDAQEKMARESVAALFGDIDTSDPAAALAALLGLPGSLDDPSGGPGLRPFGAIVIGPNGTAEFLGDDDDDLLRKELFRDDDETKH